MKENEVFGTNLPSIINNPFEVKHLKYINIMMSPKLFNEGFDFNARVTFVNGDTEGTQNFKGTDMVDLYLKVYEFCKSLDKH